MTIPKDPAMTRSRSALLAALPLVLAGGLLAVPANADTAPETPIATDVPVPPTKGELRLAKLLEGRVAGEPQACIRSFGNQRVQTIPGTAFVYGAGDTIWVQRTANPEQIDDTDTLVTNRFNASQLCRFDVMTTIDRFNGFFTGAVFFEDFVPYTRKGSKGAAEG